LGCATPPIVSAVAGHSWRLLFVGGVMNMLWIVALTLLILVEKVTPFGRQFAAVAGTVLIATGAWLLSTVLS